MLQEVHTFPPLPDIGRPETYYARLVRHADRHGDHFAHEAAKVGQYVTLAISPRLDWPAKLRYFQHALQRHCIPPAIPGEDVWLFYKSLSDLVRRYAGQEALRLASEEDDLYANRIRFGAARSMIEMEAETFFLRLLPPGNSRPPWFNEEDWDQLKLLRCQWI